MTEPTNHEQTIRDRQTQMLGLLGELLTLDLPPVSWQIGAFGNLDSLLGYITDYRRPPGEIQADIARWSAHLGTPVTQRLVRRQNRVELLVTGKREIADHGVIEIQIFAHMDRPAEPRQPAEAEA
jgi:hypothetical protein